MSETPSYPDPLELVYYPAPVLRRTCAEVTVFDDALRLFCERMLAAMEHWKGVGLAAPQVGVARRIFVTNHTGVGPDATPDRRIWINPRLEQGGEPLAHEEGCLSIPGVYAQVERPARVTVTYQDVHGEPATAELDGGTGEFLAVVVQHEADHLDGVLFLDHVAPTHLALQRRRLKELEKAYKRETGSAGSVLRR